MRQLNGYNIYFDICALAFLSLLIFYIFFRKMTFGTSNKIFLMLILTTFAATLSELIGAVVPFIKHPLVNYAAHCSYLLMRNLIVLTYVVYMVSLTDTWHKLIASKFRQMLLIVPYSVILVALMTNGLNSRIFGYDIDGNYIRGDCMFLLYVCSFAYTVLGIGHLIKYRKLFSAEKAIALIAIVPFSMIAVIIQGRNKYMMVEMFATVMALLFIIITVQNTEELKDSLTMLRKYRAYGADMKRSYINDKHVGVMLVNISNYSSLQAILGYDKLNFLIRNLAQRFVTINKEGHLHAALYYLDRGHYRFVVPLSKWDALCETAEKINSELKQGFEFDQMTLNLIAHISVARCPEDIPEFETLMAFGHELKNIPYSGRVIRAEDIAKKSRFHLRNELDAIIEDAISNRIFEVYYQPIYSIADGGFVCAEALLRLRNEKYGFISPELFIPAAERSGAIHRIGEIVMEEVCKFISSGVFEELGLKYIEVNLSVAQCMQTDLADKILEIMGRYGVSSDKINLEITETAASYSQNIMMSNLDKLIKAGVEFSLDDYGTGYSNIKSVASLPIKIVKLDKTFVDNESNPRMWTVLKNTIKMIKDMNMHIVVEGIETEGLMKKFAELECEYIQGYYYSKPIPEDAFIEFMRKHPINEKKAVRIKSDTSA